MRLWCAYSGHGFGHLAQLAAILNHLADSHRDVEIRLVGNLPPELVAEMMTVPYSLETRAQDVGLIQRDALTVDLEATRRALRSFHDGWEDRVEVEMRALRVWRPDRVVADVPYLAIDAAARLGIPTLVVASLSWDHVLSAYFTLDDVEVRRWWGAMCDAYRQADVALLPDPAIRSATFPHAVAVPPIVRAAVPDRAAVRKALGVDDAHPLVAIAFGGLTAGRLPFDSLVADKRCIWVLPGTEADHDNLVFAGNQRRWMFPDITAAADAVVGKPSYNQAVESVTHDVPFLYVRRGTFPDEEPICEWLREHGCSREMQQETFHWGDWYSELEALWAQPVLPAPRCDGAARAARQILFLKNR